MPPDHPDGSSAATGASWGQGDGSTAAASAAALSESRLKVLLQSAPVGIFMLVSRVFVEVNDRLCELTGYPRESLLGQSTRLFFTSEAEFLRFGQELYAQLARDGSTEFEFRLRRRDGLIIDTLLTCAAVERTDLCQGIVSTLRDVTALRRANARLLEAQRLARLGDWHYDIVADRLQWSPRVFANLGLDPREEPLDLAAAAALLDPDQRALVDTGIARALAEGAPFEHELKVVRPDGSPCYLHARGQVERDTQGRPTSLSGTLQDITERRQTEERLRQVALVFDNISEGVVITDAQTRILAVNQSFTRITGYAESEVLGQTPRVLHSGRHDQGFYAWLWASLIRSGEWHGEIWNRRKSGEVYPEWLTISAVPDQSGQTTHYVAVFSDISQLKRSEERLDFLAHHDALTGLPNRVLLQDRLAHAIRRARRDAGSFALLFVDLDGFKEVNDTLGHAVGDRVLVVVAQRLGERLRAADTLARQGGDEFLILLDGGTDATGAAAAADSCLSVLAEPILVDTHAIHVSASIGIALFPADGVEVETLLQSADLAMYRAKEHGRGHYQFHTPEMTAAIQEQHALETALRGALARDELRVHYQPQVELADGRLCGIEALVRWTHPELGQVPPARFIPIAERIGLVSEIGDWVLAQACAQLAAWRATGLAVPAIAVNVSIQQLERGTLLPALRRVLAETGIGPGDLELEVTESVIMGDNPRVITALSDLRALGVRLVVDDFGTGSSALGRLNRVPIDRLKVHGSFVRDLGRGPRDKAIIRAIIGLGRDLGLEVLALGVEREVQSNVLIAVDCRYAQGYLFGPPMDAASLGVHLVHWPMMTR